MPVITHKTFKKTDNRPNPYSPAGCQPKIVIIEQLPISKLFRWYLIIYLIRF